MSLVTLLATEDFLTVMSDGRITCSDENASRVVCESYFKILCPKHHYFIAFTGDLTAIEDFNGMSGILSPEKDWEAFSVKMHKKLMELTQGEVYVSYALGGKNIRNEIEFFIFGTHRNRVEHVRAIGPGSMKFRALVSENIDMGSFAREISGFLDEMEARTPENALGVQKQITERVAALDKTVNTNTYHIIIEK